MMIVAKKLPIGPFEKLMAKFDLEKENPDGGILNKIKRCLRLKKFSEESAEVESPALNYDDGTNMGDKEMNKDGEPVDGTAQ